MLKIINKSIIKQIKTSKRLFSEVNNHKEFTPEEIESITANLNKKLGPEVIAKRQGPGGYYLTYIEGWKAIELANGVFKYLIISLDLMGGMIKY